MTGLTIEALGLTKEDAAERVIQAVAQNLCFAEGEDEDGFRTSYQSAFASGIEKAIRTRIDAEVARIADEVFAPRVTEIIEGTTMQATNEWGEARGQKLTFREYLVQRAEAYMTEEVNFEGKTRKQSGGYSWTASGTRVAHMVHQHLHYQIERAMKEALGNLNSTVAKGLHEATKIALNGVLAGLKVEVKTK